MDIVNSLSCLNLDLVGDDWLQQAWDTDFMELDEISLEYEEFLMETEVNEILELIISCLRKEVDCGREDTSSHGDCITWEYLIENKVQHKQLLVVLAYFMHAGFTNSGNVKLLERCFKATSLFYLLVSIPGSDAYYVFQPSVYEKTLKTFTISSLLQDSKGKSLSKGRRKRMEVDNEDEEAGDDYDGGGAAGEGESLRNLSAHDKMNVRKGLNIILRDLLLMVNSYALKVEDTLEKTIVQLISHTRLNTNSTIENFDSFRLNGDVASFICNSCIVLCNLCTVLHGRIDETVHIILFHLLPNILMVGDFTKDMALHNLNIIRTNTEAFILWLLKIVKEAAYSAVCIFIQHLCARVTDKADYRQKVSQSVVIIMNSLPPEQYLLIVKWLLQFAHDVKASHRLFSLEVISKLLYEEERVTDEGCQMEVTSDEHYDDTGGTSRGSPEPVDNNEVQPAQDVVSHKYLLGVLFSRCYDQSGTVRTKALSTLVDCLRSNNKVVAALMKEIFVLPYVDNDIIENDSIIERGFLDTKLFLESLNKPSHQQVDPLPGGKAVVEAITSLAEDDKVFVRKSAFQMLEYIMRLNRKWVTQRLLKLMCDHCRDPAVLIKKLVIQSLTDLMLLYPDNSNLAVQYIEAVLPQISHIELKVQEKVLEAFQSTIIQKLTPYENLGLPLTQLPWTLLEVIIDLKKRKFLQITCSILAKQNMLPKNLVPVLKTHVGTENNVAAWLLLSCICPFIPIKSPEFVVDYFRAYYTDSSKATSYAVVKALDVLGSVWKYLPRNQQDQVCFEMLEAIKCMRLNITLIGPAMDVALVITCGQAAPDKSQEAIEAWSLEILEKVEDYFQQNSPCKNDCPQVNMEEFMRYLVTLGDVAQLCPGKVRTPVAVTLTGILFPEKLHDPERWRVPGLQAVTVITLGKICLQNECLAKRVVPALGYLLLETKDVAVKVNVMNALSDMCVRFTAVVEPLLPEMSLCLKDDNKVVRHYAVTIFVRLLQQDFLKLRGCLFYHIMSMLVDSESSIVQLTKYYLTQCAVTRNKCLMYQSIVESIFYYNRYEDHPAYSKMKLTPREASLFNMSGSHKRADRLVLYKFMCEHMSDEHKMQAIHKICVDVLGGVTNEVVSLNGTGSSVLEDAFLILSCDEICLNSLKTQPEDEPATDDAERVTSAMNTAKKNLISQFVKKQVIEIIIPILMQLKTRLQAAMSPLLNNLMGYLRNILKDYKNEIKDIFAEDKTLAEEILFDIRNFEEQQQRNRGRRHDSDEEEGCADVDHMRPLLVELATDHLRARIQPVSSEENNEIARPENEPQPCTSGTSPGCTTKSKNSQDQAPNENTLSTTISAETGRQSVSSAGNSSVYESRRSSTPKRPRSPGTSYVENTHLSGTDSRICEKSARNKDPSIPANLNESNTRGRLTRQQPTPRNRRVSRESSPEPSTSYHNRDAPDASTSTGRKSVTSTGKNLLHLARKCDKTKKLAVNDEGSSSDTSEQDLDVGNDRTSMRIRGNRKIVSKGSRSKIKGRNNLQLQENRDSRSKNRKQVRARDNSDKTSEEDTGSDSNSDMDESSDRGRKTGQTNKSKDSRKGKEKKNLNRRSFALFL